MNELKGGYFGTILTVDLSSASTSIREIDDEFADTYIGGRGFLIKMIWDHLREHGAIDPLGPENILAVAAGPLSGVYMPSSGKNSFASISPATGIYGDSSMGGSFGVELRQAGYDAVAIHGRADQ